MTDRYHSGHGGYTPTTARSSAAMNQNPTRSSMPSSIGYNSLYSSDVHPVSSSPRHPMATPRSYTTTTSPTGISTTTRTYAVTQEPSRLRTSTSANPDPNSARNRRSTLDTNSRPPVIVTTMHKDGRPQVSSPPTNSPRLTSPTAPRHSHRASEGQAFTQPASSGRSRSQAPEEQTRRRDRSESVSARDAEAYRRTRPSVLYPSDPRHSSTVADFEDVRYQYTNAGELARYDLDNTKPSRNRRRESVDRGYYRPNVSYNVDSRSFNVNASTSASADPSRSKTSSTNRQHDGSRGPPPSTRGFDWLDRSPPAVTATLASPGRLSDSPAISSEWRPKKSSARPVSLIQDPPTRSARHDDYYQSQDDDRVHDRTRDWESHKFHDDRVSSRGFGIKVDDFDDRRRDRRRESWKEDLRKRSDEDVQPHDAPIDRDSRQQARAEAKEERRARRNSRRADDDGGDRDRSRFREQVAAGAAGYSGAQDGDGEAVIDSGRTKGSAVDGLGDDLRTPERDHSADRVDEREYNIVGAYPDEQEADSTERRHTAESSPRSSGGNLVSHSGHDSSERTPSRQRRYSNPFDPNDTTGIREIREQLAAAEISDRVRTTSHKSLDAERSRSRSVSVSASRDGKYGAELGEEDPRGRELKTTTTTTESDQQKTVRVVSPPREKPEEKPLKGILKQPRASFPEETNFIREGAAPHKEDKKAKEVPPGAKWTKIPRKFVNPEALELGKERFEVRDDFVIVLRVLTKDEIQDYAAATQTLRERREEAAEAALDAPVRTTSERDRSSNTDDQQRRNRSSRRRKEDAADERAQRHQSDGEKRRHHGNWRDNDDDDDFDDRRTEFHRRSYRD